MNDYKLVINGHCILKKRQSEKNLYASRYSYFKNVIRMFRVKPLANIPIQLKFKEKIFTTYTLDDGEFKFIVPYKNSLSSGWHKCTVQVSLEGTEISRSSEILKPYVNKFGVISDIDDTFLVSYSGNIIKKLGVLLFKNVTKRKLFDGVAEHYLQLSLAGVENKEHFNAFFYVSSSEWNLYPLIEEFRKIHSLPKSIIHL